jgi:hypothetical protein
MQWLRAEYLVYGGAVLALGGGAGARLSMNAILRVLQAENPGEWERLGSPSGLFAQPRGRFRLVLEGPESGWLISAPQWLRGSASGARWLTACRVASVLMLVGILSLLAAAFMA